MTKEKINCHLCSVNDAGPFIETYEYWNVLVCLNQHTLGSLVTVLKNHKELFSTLNKEEVVELLGIVKATQNSLDVTFKPDWYNVQQNGNWEHHLHVHIIPRYKDERIFQNRIFKDATFGQPVQYTSVLEKEDFIQPMTELLRSNFKKEGGRAI